MLPASRRLALLTAASIVLFLIFSVLYSIRRQPWNDEGWFASPSVNLARHGFFGTTVLEPTGSPLRTPPYGIQSHTYWVLPAYLLMQAASYKIFGFSAFWMRVPSILFGLAGLLAFYYSARKLTGSDRVAQVGTMLLAVDTLYVNMSALGRMDMMAAALGWIALASFLRFRESNFEIAIAASYTILALACFTHHQAALAGIALLATTLYLDRRRLRIRHGVVAAIPFLLMGLGWGLYGAQRPDYFWSQLRSNAAGRLETLTHPLVALQAEVVRRYGVVYGFEEGSHPARKLLVIVPACYFLSIVWGLCSSAVRTRYRFAFLCTVLGLLVLYQFLFEGMKLSLYLVHLTPWYMLVFATWLVVAWEQRLAPRAALAALLILCWGAQAGSDTLTIWKNNYHRMFRPVKEELQKYNQAGDLIYGSPELGLDIGFDHVVDDLRLGFYSGKRPTAIMLDRRYRDWMDRFRSKEPEVAGYIETLLRQYAKVYDAGGYAIYADRPR